jgi:hypothetical protein
MTHRQGLHRLPIRVLSLVIHDTAYLTIKLHKYISRPVLILFVNVAIKMCFCSRTFHKIFALVVEVKFSVVRQLSQ